MRERLLEGFQLESGSGSNVKLVNKLGYSLSVDLISKQRNVYRIRVEGKDRPISPSTLPLRQPDFSKPAISAKAALTAALSGDSTQAVLDFTKSPQLSITDTKSGEVLHKDLPNRAYSLSGFGIRHYASLDRSDIHFGLGEVGAPLDLTGRQFNLRTSDTASYDAYSTSMQYKHTPFIIRMSRQTQNCTAYYSSSSTDSVVDIGASIDEPWGAYRSFEVETGGFEMYVFSGTLPQVSATMAWLTGKERLMPPRWAMGYLSSSMGIAESDDPPAQYLVEGFLNDLIEHDVPCSGLHLSSGYTVTQTDTGFARNVFTLNTDRFPDFPAFCRKWHAYGMRIVPNIKPYLATTHPDYANLDAAGGFFKDPADDKTCKTYIWSLGICETLTGSWVDTSSKAGFGWWYNGASKLIQMGVDGLWNDNDEYSLHDDTYTAAWEIPALPGQDGKRKEVGLIGRTTFTELLGRSSHQALLDNSPGRRPYILTRSANLNTMQYVCSTWSGDNRTSWRTLKGNAIQTINASLSYHSYGSDIGGFAGPSPNPELLLRWCQINAYHTRFSIHSWKPISTTAWMHEEVFPLIRDAIKRRYELLPYLYSLHHEGRELASPPVTWLGWGEYAADPRVLSQEMMEEGDFWLGAGRLLIAGVYEPGLEQRSVYLPRSSSSDNEKYFALSAPFGTHKAGSDVVVATPKEVLPVFARAGAVLPIGKAFVTIASDLSRTTNDGTQTRLKPGYIELDDWRAVEIFPPTDSTKRYSGTWTEDDGEAAWPCPLAKIQIDYWTEGKSVNVKARWLENEFKPFWGSSLHILLPVGDSRSIAGANPAGQHRDGRKLWKVEVQP